LKQVAKQAKFALYKSEYQVLTMRMPEHPRKPKTKRRAHQCPQIASPQGDIHGFFAALFALIAPHRFERLAEYRNSKRGRPPELPLTDLLAALLFHFLCGAGTASEHLFPLLGRKLCASPVTSAILMRKE
jgi:hypothetical protein